ncbi:hypothetical protein [Nonomuraea rubra]|uniref:Uncharacterized protein n=1 Tax=Nonomuraea rubra TaxID=46180 RepID=A0A7X0P6B0_9ACTN|nr:hypothetical protein [Nonomuraea rubra]MBB6556088.1 hypothetical protein [Nonomuraea rubra]
MTQPPPTTIEMRDFERRLHIVEHTYPAWSIRRRARDWIALRITQTPAEQTTAGVRHFIIEPSLDALVAALDEQLLITQVPDAA